MRTLSRNISILLLLPVALSTQHAYAVQKAPALPGVRASHQTPAELQQLVAPIALYPDVLIGQVLTASTFPTEIAAADYWMKHTGAMAGTNLAQQVDRQTWDASTKTLTEFPKVLANMDSNLAWTSSLGEAYINQPVEVLNAVQVMRKRAQAAGNLNSTSQQTVSNQSQGVSVQPTDAQTVYVPQYNPWSSYGNSVQAFPNWSPSPGLYLSGAGTLFGQGYGSSYYAGMPWGWNAWNVNWNRGNVTYSGTVYTPHNTVFNTPTPVFFPRQQIFRGSPSVPVQRARNNGAYYGGNPRVYRNNTVGQYYGQGTRSTVFTSYNRSNITRANSNRGQVSIGRGYGGGGMIRSGGGGGMIRGGGGGGMMRGGGGGGGIRRR